jgi:hypothetical protein
MADDVRGAIVAIPAAERWGSLRFFGEWFGGRPYDSQHTLTDVLGDNSALVLSFDGGETLTIWKPTGVSVADDGLRIARAARVRWEWFYYGRPKASENRYSIDYRVNADGSINVADTGDWYEPRHHPDPSADAVGFLKAVQILG